jgi:hypothetical protein
MGRSRGSSASRAVSVWVARVLTLAWSLFWAWFALMHVVSDGVKSLLPVAMVLLAVVPPAMLMWRSSRFAGVWLLVWGVAAVVLFRHNIWGATIMGGAAAGLGVVWLMLARATA